MNDFRLSSKLVMYNRKNMIIVSILLLFLIVIKVSLYYYTVHNFASEGFNTPIEYMVLYAIFFILSMFGLIYALRVKVVGNAFTASIIIAILLISGFITILDQLHFGHQFIYIITLLLIVIFFVLPIRLIIPIIILSNLFFIYITYLQKDIYSGYQLAIVFYIFITFVCCFVSIGVYLSHKQLIYSQEKLAYEIVQAHAVQDELRTLNIKLEKMAETDTLTTLPNRLAFNRYSEALTKIYSQNGIKVHVLAIDIDFFKDYNDYYGHLKGDEILSFVGGMLSDLTKKYNAYAIRWGGEEFLVVFDNHQRSEVETFCKLLQISLANAKVQHEKSKVNKYLTISGGVYSGEITNTSDLLNLIRLADIQLYKAKNGRRNTIQFVYDTGDSN